eukprot:10302358-Ditylum_brightwellii.AAC.1
MVHGRDCVRTDGTVFFIGVDDGADGVDGAEKHLIHLSQVANCCQAEVSEQNKHLVSDEDDDVHNSDVYGEDDSVGNGDDDDGGDGGDSDEKHLVHLSQVADCHLAEISKQNEHLVLEQDEDVDNVDVNGEDVQDDADDGDDDSVGNGDGADDDADGAEKYLIHLSQVANCCWAEISKQNEHLVSNEDDDVDNGDVDGEDDSVGNGDGG